eukprot:CAMPEP_0173209512 /NCGR_PEP_ID=MMETSP1141-20130122/23134_1 /TAXON_ID=483371 /ORGANISM="non described non described, Strain CCMP2298" /LENGTH=39 /DNA_ID= /DNA_START= /DNA_END= /DNA_ORIENTATION=
MIRPSSLSLCSSITTASCSAAWAEAAPSTVSCSWCICPR